MRTESGESGNGCDLRENAVQGVRVDKGDLQAEETDARNGVDQLHTGVGEVGECHADVSNLVRNVVDARPSLGKEAPDRSVLGKRGKELDPARADEQGCCLDTLVQDNVAVFERSPNNLA